MSAGNDGPGAGTLGSPGNAKNALTVGALLHGGLTGIASFSSRGPTADGRTKPDITAPGNNTISARGSTNVNSTPQAPQTATLSGTSMAAPTIAGNVVLARQFFADGWYPRGEATAEDALNLSGPAMKAVMLNGTNPLSNWPNNNTGWGRGWLDGNLWFKATMPNGDDSRRLRLFERTNGAGLETGDTNEYTFASIGPRRRIPRDTHVVRSAGRARRRVDADQQPRSRSRRSRFDGLSRQSFRERRIDAGRHGRHEEHGRAGAFHGARGRAATRSA